MVVRDILKGWIADIVKEQFGINYTEDEIAIEYPENKNFGDYSTTIPFKIAKELKAKGQTIALPNIANTIKEGLESKNNNIFDSIKVANGGFINLCISNDSLEKLIKEVANNENYGESDFGKGKGKILLEYVSANPTGPLHIGHARWAAIGDTLYRCFKTAGYDIDTEFYINDAGKQVELLIDSVEAVRKGEKIPENGYHGYYINELARINKSPIDIILEWHKEDLKEFRVHFDNWFSELSLHRNGEVEETLKILSEKGLVYEKEGALWFKSTDFGDDKDRVVKKSNGEYTYFGVDIAYHLNKIKRGYSRLINIWGADHHGYVKRLTSAVTSIHKDVKIEIILGQLVSLFRGGDPVRMSKRTGDIITLREVIEEVGTDAVRYFMISKKVDTHINFDLEIAKKQSDENPVYYLQYAHARIAGIIRNSQGLGIIETPIIDNQIAREIAVMIIRFPEEIIDITLSLDPQRMTNYLHELATLFHKFYSEYRVIDNNKVLTGRKILVKAIKNVLRKGLWIIGVSAPESM
ncbi:MAG: arginine--tRNA ligase [Brevinematales bacterium]|nr:arginine--tRNA ligase [Brevinematales bacterium]